MRKRPAHLAAMAAGLVFSSLASAIWAPGHALAQMPVPPVDVGAARHNRIVVPVQAIDPRVGQLEEQVRALNGRIEDLNFLVLELQEMLRKQQKDNEFRFQELENGKGAAPQQSGDAGGSIEPNDPQNGVAAIDPATGVQPGAPQQNLGTVTFDANGNPIGGNPSANNAVAGAGVPAGLGDTELFEASYNLVLAGDYGAAESALQEHISRFPKSKRASDAKYWLGESQLGQEKYTDAAESFLAISRDYPKSQRAPEALLKLGISMAALKKNDIACATFSEVIKRYPDADGALKSRIDTEKAAAQC